MRALLPYLALYRRCCGQLTLGVILAVITMLTSVSLLMLSNWFLAAASVASAAGLYSFNYMLPAAGMRGAAIIRTTGRWAERVVSHDATFRVLQHLRLYIFSSIVPLSPGALAHFRQAELLNSLVADVDTLDHLYLRVLSPLVGALIITFVLTISLVLLYPRSGYTLGTVMLIILILFPPIFYRIGKPIGEALTILQADYRLLLHAWLSSNAELALYGAAEYYRHQLDSTEQLWQKYQQRKSALNAFAHSLLLLITGFTLTLVLWFAAGGVENNGLSGALIAIFAFATLAILEVLGPVAGSFQQMGQVIASAARLNIIINQPPEVVFPAQSPIPADSVTISISQIRFHYPDKVVNAIDDISLTIKAGEHIAILGHTGSGKSTLLRLLTRAWDSQEGVIMLNGVVLQEWSESALRTMIAVMPQRIHIFSSTLRDNLHLATQNIADDEQLCKVVQQVGLDKLLIGQGLNTWLGEGGRVLSGGEQRRIGIARILLRAAPVWLLDEPTEGLDTVTEQHILQLLIKLGQGRTIVIVTHRLHGLEQFDRILIMDRGTFIKQDTYHP